MPTSFLSGQRQLSASTRAVAVLEVNQRAVARSEKTQSEFFRRNTTTPGTRTHHCSHTTSESAGYTLDGKGRFKCQGARRDATLEHTGKAGTNPGYFYFSRTVSYCLSCLSAHPGSVFSAVLRAALSTAAPMPGVRQHGTRYAARHALHSAAHRSAAHRAVAQSRITGMTLPPRVTLDDLAK